MPKRLKLPKIDWKAKALHNDMHEDLATLSDQDVMNRIMSARHYHHDRAYKYWSAVWKERNIERDRPPSIMDMTKIPASAPLKRPRSFHVNYYDERTIGNDVIIKRIANAVAWCDELHARRWTRILDERLKEYV